ncbi:energy transducer TonB [Brachyspira pilosicoli]|uniref:energy transducer TonB family protein n=1 Tax=Brachyspira pilosicoli TaxID=52584 RepID=UPI001CA5AB82|nr:energy transducer TonB [Brachyspira pilosicoli]MBW5396199.1 energy transducer TonB [Brachyspira pilosicoli]
MKDFLGKLKTIIFKKKDTIFAVIVSFILHIFVLSLVNTYIMESLFAYNDKLEKLLEEEKNKKDDYMFLVETPDVEEEENNEDTPFASDKSLVSRGQIDVTPSKVFSDSSVFSFLGDGANSPIVERRDNINPNNNNNLQKQKDLGNDISREDVVPYKPKNPGLKGDTKIPASFEDGADRAVVLSSETGSIQLGTKAQEYFWYFYTLVGSIRDSWYLTIPNQAHFLGLLRSDEVEVLISIDLDGNIIFEKFLSNSKLGQSSLDNSCSKAIEYAKKLKPPPQGLVRDYAENGKIYIPFKFIYQNFSRE